MLVGRALARLSQPSAPLFGTVVLAMLQVVAETDQAMLLPALVNADEATEAWAKALLEAPR